MTPTAKKYGLIEPGSGIRYSIKNNEIFIKKYDKLLKTILEIAENSVETFLPLCIFINYYKNGDIDCNPHTHGCRQFTVSFGNERVMKVDDDEIIIKHGHGIFLNGEEHSIPKMEKTNENYNIPRISFNLFFTTKEEANFNIFNQD